MSGTASGATVVSVHRSPIHGFSKEPVEQITLLEGMGVQGDAHCGVTVKHRSRVRADPSQPNLRQVHLMHQELFDELREVGFDVSAGELGENITTNGVDLLGLPVGTRLIIGTAVIAVTGLRNPCHQINDFQDGLLKHVVSTEADGTLHRRAGVMGVVWRGGAVRAGDPIEIDLPPLPHHRLTRV